MKAVKLLIGILMVLFTVYSASAALPANNDVDIVYSMEITNVNDDANNATQAGDQGGSSTGTVTIAGKLGGALDFDGGTPNSDHVDIGVAGFYHNNTAKSWCGWYNRDTDAALQWLWSMGGEGSSPNDGFPGVAYVGANDTFNIYGGNGAIIFEVENKMDVGSWYHICMTWDGNQNGLGDANDINFYINGTNVKNKQLTHSISNYKDLIIASYWDASGTPKTRSGFTGQVDEFLFFGSELSASTVSSLYNSGTGDAYPWGAGANPPVVVVYGPDEGQVTNNATVRFSYTADEPDTGANMNVTLYINGTKNVTAEITNVTAIHEINESFLAGEYQFVLEVVDASGESTNSSDYNFTVDFTEPPHTQGANSNVTITNSTAWNIHRDGDSIIVNFNTSDPELFRYDINITAPNGSVEYTHTANDLNVTEYNRTFTINVSTPGTGYVGQYNISLLTADGHTARWIDPIPYATTSNSITFTYSNGVTCKFESEEANLKGLSVEHSTDRMNWTIETNSAKTEHGFILDCSAPVTYFDRFDFPSFVIYPAWFDFAVRGTQPDEYVVNRLDPTKWSINVKYLENTDEIAFESTGLVNINKDDYSFTSSKTPFNPQNVSTDTIEASTIFFNWTAATGASFYEVTRDGVNVANTSSLFYNFTGLSTATTYELGASSVYNDSDITFYLNASGTYLNATTTFNGSLSVEVRNEVTNDRLVGPLVFINLLGTTANITGNTTTGTIGLTNLSSDNYTIRHNAIGWGSRDQYLEIGANDTGSIILYLINDTIRDPGIVYVRDTQSDGVNGSIVKLLRYLGDENLYRVVQMATTNEDGRAVFDAEAFDAYYKWVVEYSGSTEVQTTVPEFLSRSASTGLWTKAFTINIGNDFWESYTAQTGMTHALTYANATRTFTYTFNDPEGLVTRACLKADYANGTSWQTLGPTCQNAATGSINLILPNENRTYHATGYYETSTKYSEESPVKLSVTLGKLFDYGQEGAFIGLVLFLGVIPLFAFNAIVGVIAVIIVTAFLSLFSAFALFPFSFTFIGALVTVGLGFVVYGMRRS